MARTSTVAAEGFLIGTVARLARVDKRTLAYWATSGFLAPSIADGQGKGTRRLYSFADLVALRVAGHLRTAGVTLQSLRRVVEQLRAQGVDSLAGALIVSDGRDVFLYSRDQMVSLLRQPGQFAFGWLVDVEAVVRELRAELAAA